MAEYEKRVREKFREYGCTFMCQEKGDHEVWQSPLNDHVFLLDSQIKFRHMANKITKEAGIDYYF
jgi:hypothetical protein